MNNCFFSSDYHFFHKNIITYQNRPFNDISEMNECLIQNHNSLVKPKDTIYMLGDIAIGASAIEIANVLKKMNGRKILIIGNHDVPFLKNIDFTSCFSELHQLLSIKINKQYIQMCHFPIEVWDRAHYGSWMLAGHTHGNKPDNINQLKIDVGVDCHNYKPISFEDVKTIMSTKEYIQYVRPRKRNNNAQT